MERDIRAILKKRYDHINSDKNLYKNPVHRRTQIRITALRLLAVILLICILLVIYRNIRLRKENSRISALEEGYYSEEELYALVENAEGEGRNEILSDIKGGLESGTPVSGILRSLFSDQILIARDGRYYFVPIDKNLRANSFADKDFEKNDKGILTYTGSREDVSGAKGIDVAKFQGDIDWEKAAADGVEFAFIRVGNRGTSQGAMSEDPNFAANIEGAHAAGIKVGVYYFSQAVDEEEAYEEALFTLEAVKGYDIELPLVIDIERPDTDSSRTSGLSKEELTDAALKFCHTVEEAGYKSMIYGNVETFTLMLDMTRLEDIEKWIAYYNLPQYFPYDFTYWQYSSTGHVDGIDTDVDLNICVK